MSTTITGVPGTDIAAQCTGPSAGKKPIAVADVNTPFQSIENDLATIKSGDHHFAGSKTFDSTTRFEDTVTIKQSVTILADGTGSQINGAWTAGGAWTANGAWTFAGSVTCTNTVTLGATCVAGSVSGARLNMVDGTTIDLQGRVRISAMKDLSDAGHILWDAVTDKRNYIRMTTGPAANRILTLPQPVAWTTSDSVTSGTSVRKANGNIYLCSQTGTTANSGTGPSGTGTGLVDGTAKWDFKGLAPIDGDWFEVTVFLGTSAFTVGLQRAGSSDYVAKLGDGVGTSPWGSSNLVGTAKVRFDGTDWKLVSVGGVAFYGVDSY